MDSLPVKPIKRQSIPEAIIQELKSLIDSGHIPKGGKLPPERKLAQILNVSRPSLRVAIKAMSLLGILENRQGDGTYLTTSDEWSIEPLSIILSVKKGALLDIFEARESIENSCAGFAALRRDEEDLKELQKALDGMDAAQRQARLERIPARIQSIFDMLEGFDVPVLDWFEQVGTSSAQLCAVLERRKDELITGLAA